MLENATAYYLSLTSQEKIAFLTLLSFHVSEIARDSYPEAKRAGDASVMKLRAYNEMLHVISKQLLAELRDRTLGYPHEVFWQVLQEDAQCGGCEAGLSWAVDKALKATEEKE
jgi:hypothetical protein